MSALMQRASRVLTRVRSNSDLNNAVEAVRTYKAQQVAAGAAAEAAAGTVAAASSGSPTLSALRAARDAARRDLAAQLLPALRACAAQGNEDFLPWADAALGPDDVWLTVISGAMTNTIYKCELKSAVSPLATCSGNPETDGRSLGDADPAAVLVRVYGEGTDMFFDRTLELEIFSRLGQVGYGKHALLCEFENGRCERFFQGSRPLLASEMYTPEFVAKCAREARAFHDLPMEGGRLVRLSHGESVAQFLTTVRSCYDEVARRAPAVWGWKRGNEKATAGGAAAASVACSDGGGGGVQTSQAGWVCVMLDALPGLMDKVERNLAARADDLVVFGHNDMQPGNILVGPGGGVTFIDFEYARFAPRGYDVANHWCEWAADYHGEAPHHMDYSKFPSPEQRRAFARAYLGAGGGVDEEDVSESAVEAFVAESLAYVQLSHIWWGVWGLLQATQSSIDFDYVGYARCRLDALCGGHCQSKTASVEEEFGGAAAGKVEF